MTDAEAITRGVPSDPRWDERVYVAEDVYLRAGMGPHYLANQGQHRPWSDGLNNTLVGIFVQLHAVGQRWPRAVNLWESSWHRRAAAMTLQYGADAKVVETAKASEQKLEDWWRSSAGHRAGGWDRYMLPGPGSPWADELRAGPKLHAIVQQRIRLRNGAKRDYLAWFAENVPPALSGSEWRAMLWLGELHGRGAIVYFGAENWNRLAALGSALPVPDAAWQARVETSALRAWDSSDYLQRN